MLTEPDGTTPKKCVGESDVDQAVAPIYTRFANPRTTILSSPGHVELHLVAEARSEAEAEALLESLAAPIRERLGSRIYSEDGRDLAQVVGGLLRERDLTLAVAESCTGGLLSARLTEAFPLRAIVLPRVTGGPSHRLMPLAPAAALRALAPSTIYALPASEGGSFRMLAGLVQRLPCFSLQLGDAVAELPGLLGRLLHDLRDQREVC